MAKYLVETYYTCSFKVNHYLENIGEKELSNLEKRDDGKYEILDIKLDNRKTKNLSNNSTKVENKLANKEKISQNPRITLSTIHGAKGGEADNVLLLPDITKSAADHDDIDPDELHRLFYVAVTRAKKSLHILEPKNYDRAYII